MYHFFAFMFDQPFLPLHRTASWEERWVQSKHKDDYGVFEWTAGKFYGDAEKDKGECRVSSV